MKKQKIFSVFRLALGLLLLLFVAGVVVPSFLYSSHVVNAVSPLDSPRTLDIAGVTLAYKFQNIGFAILGALFGATVALTIASPGTAFRGSAFLVTVLRARRHPGASPLT